MAATLFAALSLAFTREQSLIVNICQHPKKKSVALFCYTVNSVTQMNEEPDKASTENIPDTIALRTEEFAPLLAKWRSQNREVPWSRLLARGLRKELAPLAGKRYAHLVEGKP